MATKGPAVSLQAVSRWYDNVVAVNDVSFNIGPGITGLLGPNGAGKSTILNMLVGLLEPSAGELRLFGEPARGNPEVYRRVGFVSERDAVYEFLTGREFVTLLARLQKLERPEEAAQKALAAVDLLDAQDRRLGEYSKGMRQRARIAGGIVHEPELLILDEPFTGTDPRQRLQMMGTLRSMAEAGRSILFSSHILEEVAQVATTVLVLVAGRLAASGNYRQIRRLMTDRPHTLRVQSSDNRGFAAGLMMEEPVSAVELVDGKLLLRTDDLGACAMMLPRLARERGVRIYEVVPLDLSLESVFSYLVNR